MDRLITWLSERKLFTVIVACAYLTVVILFHKEVSAISDWVTAKLSFKLYNDLIFLISLVMLVVFEAFVLIKIIKGEQRFLKLISWILTTFLVVLSYQTLIVFNVEIIHFPQYAILALPVFALFRTFGETVFWVTLLGALDEAFQYFILHPETSFDFNDIILNLIGAGIGVVLISILWSPKVRPQTLHNNRSRKLNRTLIFAITAWILLGGVSLYAAGILRFSPDANTPNALIVLRSQPPPTQFWTVLGRGKPYHQLHPIGGIFFSAVLIGCYSLMDYVLKKHKDKAKKHT
jgi:VanZ family protein